MASFIRLLSSAQTFVANRLSSCAEFVRRRFNYNGSCWTTARGAYFIDGFLRWHIEKTSIRTNVWITKR